MDWVAAFCEATYMLARFHPPRLAGWLGGRQWERWASMTLTPAGAWMRQGPGSLTLFGRPAASGLSHELDGAGICDRGTLITEAKAYGRSSPTKADVMLFDRKTFDLFLQRRRGGEAGPHWRVLVSASPIHEHLRKYCYLYGIVAVEPDVIPLPILLRMASRAIAEQYFSDVILGELVRLGEPASGPLEARYVPDGPNHLRFDLRTFNVGALNDLLWLQQTMTADLLELVDEERPGYFEDRADELLVRLGIAGSTDIPRSPKSEVTNWSNKGSEYRFTEGNLNATGSR